MAQLWGGGLWFFGGVLFPVIADLSEANFRGSEAGREFGDCCLDKTSNLEIEHSGNSFVPLAPFWGRFEILGNSAFPPPLCFENRSYEPSALNCSILGKLLCQQMGQPVWALFDFCGETIQLLSHCLTPTPRRCND